MLRKFVRSSLKLFAFGVVMAMIPVAAFAASGYFTSSSNTTPAVKGVNSSSASGAAGVFGEAAANSSTQRFGVDGYGVGPGGIGVWGAGAKYGVYSNGNLGVASGKSLLCSQCIGTNDISVPSAGLDSTEACSCTGDIGSWNVDFTTGGMQANSSGLTIPVGGAGVYEVIAQLGTMNTNSSGGIQEGEAWITVNGSRAGPPYASYDAPSTGGDISISLLLQLSAGASIKLHVVQAISGVPTFYPNLLEAHFVSHS